MQKKQKQNKTKPQQHLNENMRLSIKSLLKIKPQRKRETSFLDHVDAGTIQPVFACSKLTIETPEQCVKSVQS